MTVRVNEFMGVGVIYECSKPQRHNESMRN